MNTLYFDNHTTTKPSKAAIDAMLPYLHNNWGLYTQPHSMGQQLFAPLKKAYEDIYAAMGVPQEYTLLIVSSHVEGFATVMDNVYHKVVHAQGKNHFITTGIDEAITILSFEKYEALGCKKQLVAVDNNGRVSIQALREAITPRTALISLSYANGLTGVVQPIEEIAAIAKERNILLHLDISYVFGKLNCNIANIAPDFVTCNGDHIHAPKGTGILLVDPKFSVSPLLVGGSEQGGLRGGPLSLALTAALQEAISEMEHGKDYMCSEIARLRDLFENLVCTSVPDTHILFADSYRLPNTTAIGFNHVIAESLLYRLNQHHVYATFGGSICQKLSYILEASGIETTIAQGALSFSLSRYTTEEEIESAARIIAQEVAALRNLSKGIVWD